MRGSKESAATSPDSARTSMGITSPLTGFGALGTAKSSRRLCSNAAGVVGLPPLVSMIVCSVFCRLKSAAPIVAASCTTRDLSVSRIAHCAGVSRSRAAPTSGAFPPEQAIDNIVDTPATTARRVHKLRLEADRFMATPSLGTFHASRAAAVGIENHPSAPAQGMGAHVDRPGRAHRARPPTVPRAARTSVEPCGSALGACGCRRRRIVTRRPRSPR